MSPLSTGGDDDDEYGGDDDDEYGGDDDDEHDGGDKASTNVEAAPASLSVAVVAVVVVAPIVSLPLAEIVLGMGYASGVDAKLASSLPLLAVMALLLITTDAVASAVAGLLVVDGDE